MVKVDWSKEILKSAVRLTDCIELLVAFSHSDYDCRFNVSDFNEIIGSEIVNEESDNFLQGEEIDDFRLYYDQAVSMVGKRAIWFEDVYPFKVDSNVIYWGGSQDLNEEHLLYLVLLVCSVSNHIPCMSDSIRLAFEELTKIAMKSMFSEQMQVLQFGPRSTDRRNVFGAAANIAVPKLANKLHAILVNEEQLPTESRDFGIDVIAIQEFEDEVPYSFFVTAQCATGEKWWEKRNEARAANELASYIHLNVPNTNFLFIPHLPRVQLDTWDRDAGRTGDCVICDRYRICRLISSKDALHEDSGFYQSLEYLDDVIVSIRGSVQENTIEL